MTTSETTGGHEDIVLSSEKRERLTALKSRLKILEEASEKIKSDPNTDISSIVNICREILDEIIEKSDAIIESEDRKKPLFTRLIEKISVPDNTDLELLKKIKEEFFDQPETFNTKDGEFADLVRGLTPYLIKLTENDILIVFQSK